MRDSAARGGAIDDELTTGNTNAPPIMIGEKGAAMIREDAAAVTAADPTPP